MRFQACSVVAPMHASSWTCDSRVARSRLVSGVRPVRYFHFSGPCPMKIVACNSNRPLAEAVANILELPLTKASIRRFADMEVFVEIQENVRGEDVFVIQPTSFPANDNLMELLVTLDALRRASARRVTAVIPYFGYARQDRKTASRSPIRDRKS